MSGNGSNGTGDNPDSNPYSDSKYQRFSSSIDRTLKSIELAKETQELSSCLAKLHKVLLAYTHFKALPHKYAVSKCLSNCLRPNFPCSIHSKVLEIYSVIFDRIGVDGLTRDLFIYTNGLFPLFDHASTQVRPQILEIFDQYLLKLGPGLLPGLQGFVMALLPGLEEGSECVQRVSSLLDTTSFLSMSAFIITLWNILYRSPSLRLVTSSYMMSHLNKGKSLVSQSLKRVDEYQDIFVLGLCSSLCDSNVTVVRHSLDIVSLLVPLTNSSLSSSQFTIITTAVLQTLMKRDNALSRRVYNWLLGNLQSPISSPVEPHPVIRSSEEDSSIMYLTSFVYPRITSAIKSTLNPIDINFNVKNFSRSEHLVAHRILKALVERNELHELLLKVLPDYLLFLKYQLKQVNHRQTTPTDTGQTRIQDRNRESLREDVFLNANQFLSGLNVGLLWDWMKEFLITDIENAKDKVTELVDRKTLILTLIEFLPQQNSEPIVSQYLPNLIIHWINNMHSSLGVIPSAKLVSFISFVSSLLNLLNQFIQSLDSTKTSSQTSINSVSLFDIFRKCRNPMSHDSHMTMPLHVLPSSHEGEGTTPTVYLTLFSHLQELFSLMLNLFNKYLNVHVLDKDVEINKELVTTALNEVGGVHFRCDVVTNGRGCVEDVLLGLCAAVTQLIDIIWSLSDVSKNNSEDSHNEPSPMISYHGLMLSALSTTNIHVFIGSLYTLVHLWDIERHCDEMTCVYVLMEPLMTSDSKLKREFIKVAAVLLWDTLTQSSLSAHHCDASVLLYQLHSLSLPSLIVEDVILERFAQASIVPYQVFIVFWKYALYQKDTAIFKRLLLRVLEGLQSTDPFISQSTVSWVESLSDTNQLSSVLLPLYNLITEATPPKRLPQYESPRTPKPLNSHAQYYFNSVPIPDDDGGKEEVPLYPLYYFTQSVDAPRLRYGLSLFLSLLSVNPVSICTHLASMYMAHSSGYSSPVDTPGSETDISSGMSPAKTHDPAMLQGGRNNIPRPSNLRASSVAKSLLELLLTHCSHILLTDYSAKLNIHESDITALTNIKITSVNVLVNVLDCIATMVHGVGGSGGGANRADGSSNLNNSTYVLCLLALCEIQKSTLVGLLQLVDIFKTDSDPSSGAEGARTLSRSLHMSLPHLQPLFLQLLKVLYYGICLESMATSVAESPVGKKSYKKVDPGADSDTLSPGYVPGVSIVLQPLFFHILSAVLSRSHLVLQQTYLLSVVCHSMVHFRESLEIIAPKLLKQVYRNLKEALTDKNQKNEPVVNDASSQHSPTDEAVAVSSWQPSAGSHCHSNEMIAVYLCTISHIVHYCLLQRHGSMDRNAIEFKKPVLHFKLADPFRSLPSLQLSSKHLPSEPTLHVPNSPSPSTDKSSFNSFGSWLFGGVFTTSTTGGNLESDRPDEGVAKPSEYCGVYAPVGQKILWQLQHVYGVVVRVWRESVTTDGGILSSEQLKKDLNNLVKQFFQPMISRNSTLFYTTVAHTWMHWNLVGKSKQLMKDSFIRLLHLYKLQPLPDLLTAVSIALESMNDSKDDSNKDRQKYLLHFLHYYLSSPLQSEEEIASSFSAIMSFVKDSYYSLIDHNPKCNTSLLCMLTSILHVHVRRSPAIPDYQSNKKQRKDLQDMIYKLCETLSTFIESSISQTVQQQQPGSKNSGKTSPEDKAHPKSVATSQNETEIQAMALLSNVIPCFIDKAYTDDRDRGSLQYLLKIVLKPVWVIVKATSFSTKRLYPHAVRLLLSITESQITRKYWRDEVLEMLMEQPYFFSMDKISIQYWKAIINNLVSQDKSVFAGILSRLTTPTPANGSGTMVGSLDQDRKIRSRILKRVAFIILSGDHNQYIGQLNDIIDKLSESASHFSCPSVSSHVLLIIRVLLVKISSDGLTPLWPILLSELTVALTELQSDLGIELATPQYVTRDRLNWYWSVCRTLETIVMLPDQVIPHWQMVSWGFFGVIFGESLEKDIAETSINEEEESPRPLTDELDTSGVNGVTNSVTTPTDRWSIMDDIVQVYKEHTQDTKQVKLPSLSRLPMSYEVKSVRQLVGFLQYLNSRETSFGNKNHRTSKSQAVMEELLKLIMIDFID